MKKNIAAKIQSEIDDGPFEAAEATHRRLVTATRFNKTISERDSARFFFIFRDSIAVAQKKPSLIIDRLAKLL